MAFQFLYRKQGANVWQHPQLVEVKAHYMANQVQHQHRIFWQEGEQIKALLRFEYWSDGQSH